MFTQFFSYIREVILRMFNRDTYKLKLGQEVAISDKMVNTINLWEKMLIGQADWINDDVQSLGIERNICKEFANVVLSEMETSIDNNDDLNTYYQEAIRNINENYQQALGLGSFVIKPLGNEGEVEYISADNIIPLEFDFKGRLKKACFMQSKPYGDDVVFYRFEYHLLDKNGLTIMNKAFKGNKGEIGNQIPLTSIDEWADLPESITYPEMDRIDFGYYRNPIPNLIDRSFNGISIFNDAISSIKKADIQASRLDWEFKSSERMIFADYTTLKKTKEGRFRLPEGKNRLMVGIDIEDKLDTYSPQIREQNFINGLEEYLRNVEFNCALAYGDLSKNEVQTKTATEIKTSKVRKYNMVNAMQKNLKDCLEDLCYALAFYNETYTSDFIFNCTFHDSILTDEETERNQDRIDMSNGIMSRIEYRMKWYNEDEETAMKKMPQIETDVQE